MQTETEPKVGESCSHTWRYRCWGIGYSQISFRRECETCGDSEVRTVNFHDANQIERIWEALTRKDEP